MTVGQSLQRRGREGQPSCATGSFKDTVTPSLNEVGRLGLHSDTNLRIAVKSAVPIIVLVVQEVFGFFNDLIALVIFIEV